MSANAINFKDTDFATVHGLDTALEMEKEKYAKCPVKQDYVPEHEMAQAWGYVVAAYFLMEESLKLLLHTRGATPGKTHTLSSLFGLLPCPDKDVLREYYRDFRCAFENAKTFPFSEVDEFLANLDGGKNSKGKHVGSFDWRYFLIEKPQGGAMPTVSIEFMHEVVYGAIRIVEHGVSGNSKPFRYTYSQRLHSNRSHKYRDWLTVRMKSDGWDELGDRLEILWGPDYRGRHDLLLFRGKSTLIRFAELPEGFSLPIVDKRQEIKSFDVDEGFRSIGVTRV